MDQNRKPQQESRYSRRPAVEDRPTFGGLQKQHGLSQCGTLRSSFPQDPAGIRRNLKALAAVVLHRVGDTPDGLDPPDEQVLFSILFHVKGHQIALLQLREGQVSYYDQIIFFQIRFHGSAFIEMIAPTKKIKGPRLFRVAHTRAKQNDPRQAYKDQQDQQDGNDDPDNPAGFCRIHGFTLSEMRIEDHFYYIIAFDENQGILSSKKTAFFKKTVDKPVYNNIRSLN